MKIYIDVIFFENFVIDYLILYSTCSIGKIKIRRERIILSSIIGAAYAIFMLTIFQKILTNIFLKILLSFIMIFIICYPQKLKKMCKMLLLFYVITVSFGGATYAFLNNVSHEKVYFYKGIIIGNYSLILIFSSAIIAMIALKNAFKNNKEKLKWSDFLCTLIFDIGKIRIKTKAFIDSGNTLIYKKTNEKVIVIDKRIIDINSLLKQNNLSTKIRWIPFSTIGKKNGMMMGIKCDRAVIIKNDGSRLNIKDVILGLYDKKISKNYSALIGINAIKDAIES